MNGYVGWSNGYVGWSNGYDGWSNGYVGWSNGYIIWSNDLDWSRGAIYKDPCSTGSPKTICRNHQDQDANKRGNR